FQREGLILTLGGEPTFNSREHAAEPEWNTEALGPTKWSQGHRLISELRRRLSPGAAVLLRFGKAYPGESLPRWALDLCGRRTGEVVWTGDTSPSQGSTSSPQEELDTAHRFIKALAQRLEVSTDFILPAYEDPWRFLQDEAKLPTEEDPLKANL